jgi:dihydrofolate synthase/folylpolyglutamate synthase
VREAAADLLAEKRIEALPTFFEHVTAIALNAFREAEIELAILETGMGGRLDATTVAGANIVGITSISLDHQEYLGETLEEIAFEKAAIIRPGVTAIVAPQSPAALAVIVKRANECAAELIVDGCRAHELGTRPGGLFDVTFETMADRYENVQLALRGRHQIENTAVAIQLAESLRSRGYTLPPAAIVRGIETASHLGRLSDHDDGRRVLLDGAHNPAAARALRDYLDEFVGEPITLVFGAMSDKRLAEIAAILFPGADRLVLTQPNNPRAAAVETLQTLAENFLPREQIIAAPRVADAMQKAREVTSPAGVICVTGSLYLVGEVSGELSRVG